MKKLLISAAMVAVAVISACNKESAAPQTFKIGAAIVDTKTSMSAQEGNTRHILWQAGDKLSVNGVESQALSAGGSSQAEFTFTTPVAGSLYAAYPSSAVKSYSAGTAVITLPATQSYTAGSFDASSAVLLGTGAGTSVSLVNAMAYMQVTPTYVSENVKIKSIQVNSFGGVVAGDFNTDFATLTPAAGNTSYRVTVECSTAVALGTPIVIAIPARTYTDKMELTIVDENDNYHKVVSKFNAEHPFVAQAGHIYPTSIAYAHDVVLPESLWMLGTGTPGGWSTATQIPSVSTGVYTIEDVALSAGNFKIYPSNPSVSGNWFPYYASTASSTKGNVGIREIPSETAGDPAFNISTLGYADGTYDVTINLNLGTVTFTSKSAAALRTIYLYGACFTGQTDWAYWAELQETASESDIYSADIDLKVWDSYNRGFKIYRSKEDWSNEYCCDWTKSVSGDPSKIYFDHKDITGDNQVCPVDFGFTDSGVHTVTIDFNQKKVTFVKK